MKVQAVSFGVNSNSVVDNYDSKFMYYRDTQHRYNKDKILQQYNIATAAVAVSAVLISLFLIFKDKSLNTILHKTKNL